MSKKHKNVCRVLNYIYHLLILMSTLTGCVLISAFASLICVFIGITSSAVGFKICAITAGIKKYKSIIKKKKERDEIVLLAKSRLKSIEVLISITKIDSVISHVEFFLINIVWKEFNDIKLEIKYW